MYFVSNYLLTLIGKYSVKFYFSKLSRNQLLSGVISAYHLSIMLLYILHTFFIKLIFYTFRIFASITDSNLNKF